MRALQASGKIRSLTQALKASEASRRAAMEASLDALICTDSIGRIIDLNSAAERTFRITRAVSLGKDLIETIFPPDLWEARRSDLFAKSALEKIDIIGTRLETRAMRANRVEFPAELTFACFKTKSKTTFHLTIRDITARQKAEETLVRLAAIVESSQDAIIGFDFEGCITTWNRGAERMTGYSFGEAMSRSMLFLMPESQVFDYTRCIADLKAGRSLENFETVWLAKDGKRVDVSLTTSSILNADGEIIGGSIIAHDITVRKHAEAALRRANETSIYGSPIPVLAVDVDGKVTFWNGAAEKAFGWKESEVRGKTNPLIPEEEAEGRGRAPPAHVSGRNYNRDRSTPAKAGWQPVRHQYFRNSLVG